MSRDVGGVEERFVYRCGVRVHHACRTCVYDECALCWRPLFATRTLMSLSQAVCTHGNSACL